jgi:D-methionine transport system ATP-binding protein
MNRTMTARPDPDGLAAAPPATPAALAAAPAMIAIESVSKTFAATPKSPAVTALDGVAIAIGRGEIYGVIGRSGAGKSTLIRAVNGLERPTSGRVVVDGVDVTALPQAELRAERRKIGMIFQHFNLLSSRTAFGNVALPLELAGVPTARIRSKVDDLLDLVGLTDKRDRYPVELSGGQKQRVGIARALATDPKVLLCDEATSALDPETTRSILGLIADVNVRFGVTIMLITHEMAVIKEICHRVGVIDGGRIIEEGDVYDVFTRPKTEVARAFLGTLNGRSIPPGLAARLKASPEGTREAVIRLSFTGEKANDPVISRLSRELNLEVAVLQGQIDEIGHRPFGTIIVTIPNAALFDGSAERFLAERGVATERLGHVD